MPPGNGSFSSRLSTPPRPAICSQLGPQVVHVELIAGGDFFGQPGGRVVVRLPLHLLDQAEHVAHAEDPRRHPVRVEGLKLSHRLADCPET